MRGRGNGGRRNAVVVILALVLVAAALVDGVSANGARPRPLLDGGPMSVGTGGDFRITVRERPDAICAWFALDVVSPPLGRVFEGHTDQEGRSAVIYVPSGTDVVLAFYHWQDRHKDSVCMSHVDQPVLSTGDEYADVDDRGPDGWRVRFEDGGDPGWDLVARLERVNTLAPPPAVRADPPCSGSVERTVTWDSVSGWWYRVQRATDPGFAQDVTSVDVQAAGASSVHTLAGHSTGTYYYRVQCRGGDGDDPTAWVETGARGHDLAPPATTHAVSGTLGNAGWYISPAQVELAAADTGCGGLQETQYRIDEGGWQVYTGPFALSDGVHVVEYTSTDAVGNAETAQSLALNVDTTPPDTMATPAGTAGDGGWWRSDVEVTIDAIDITSGVEATGYRLTRQQRRYTMALRSPSPAKGRIRSNIGPPTSPAMPRSRPPSRFPSTPCRHPRRLSACPTVNGSRVQSTWTGRPLTPHRVWRWWTSPPMAAHPG
jgi:hypothetical protein